MNKEVMFEDKTISNSPSMKKWKDILEKIYKDIEAIRVTERLPEFLIAGGYCRDLLMKANNGFHDLDVFVSIPTDDELCDDYLWLYAERLQEVLGLGEGNISVHEGFRTYEGRDKADKDNRFNNILDLYCQANESYITVQFIGVNNADFSDPLDYVEKQFDIGACMCYYNGTEVVPSKLALVDILGKKFTIINDSPNSKERVKRFVNRYYPKPGKVTKADVWAQVYGKGFKPGEMQIFAARPNVGNFNINIQAVEADLARFNENIPE